MHDCVWFESQGVPSVVVVSSGFVEAAAKQAEALGMPEVRTIIVSHPIQNRTEMEMRELADAAYDEIAEALLR